MKPSQETEIQIDDGIYTKINYGMPLCDLLDFVESPRRARIVSGMDVLTRVQCGISADTIFQITRPSESPHSQITLSYKPDEGGTPRTVQLPVDSPIEFVLLPYEPGTETRDQLTYSSVSELARCFPPFARVQSLTNKYISLVRPGNTIKLLRLVIGDNNEKFIECRIVSDSRLFNLPFDCIGEFVAVFDGHVTYTLADLVCGHVMPVRSRRVVPADRRGDSPSVDDLPPGVSLIVEPPLSVEARPVDDPTTVIRLPERDDAILVSCVSDSRTAVKGQTLASITEDFHGMFPFAVRVDDWKEETTILENHFVRPGVELVLHGITRVQKVLATTSGRFYSLPVTYRGLFRRRPRMFAGARQLEQAAAAVCRWSSLNDTGSTGGVKVELIVRVVYLSLQEQLAVELGDRLCVDMASSDAAKGYVTCEKLNNGSSSRHKGKEFVKIPVTSNASFEEVLSDGCESATMTIDELAKSMITTGSQLRVELTQSSDDTCQSPHHDLPLNSDVILTDVLVEMSLFASVDSPDRPAFHLPLRTAIYVSFTGQLDRRASPLLNTVRRGSSAKVSTLDRCAELLSTDTVSLLRQTVLDKRQSSLRDETSNGDVIIASAQLPDIVAAKDGLRLVVSPNINNRPPDIATDINHNGGPRKPRSASVVTFATRDEEEEEDDTEVVVSAKAGGFKLRIPDDGNLYNLSSKRIIDLLNCLNLDRQVIDACHRRRMDGKLFSRLSEQEMEFSGLMNPVLLHFRRLTTKKNK